MGVSGCGKSTVGHQVASRLGLRYVEGDELHPPGNVALMAAGTPLTDEDRKAWLDALAEVLQRASAPGVVVSCSALKRAYRDRLRMAAPGLRLVHLMGAPALLAERLRARSGHYMPASLLASQLSTLQMPEADEHAFTLDVALAPVDLADAICQHLQAVA
jgi:carbohydrate kinase (thermoresistant glucokinase family)